ncbi:MAG: lysoplasmalogenase [Saprospiraceae bacterium]|nr:lysoplasmalogenase [Saprospiraceae bacterium]
MNKTSGHSYRYLVWGYLLLSLIHIYATGVENVLLIYITKPLLLTLLSVWFWLNTKDQPTAFSRFVLFGLIFSIGGDTFLMFVEKGPNYFIYGLICFLLAHVAYATGFLKYKSKEKGLLQRNPWVAIFFLVFLIGNTAFLWPGIPADLKIPVTVYSIAIVTMAATAANLSGKIPSQLFTMLFLGVLLFVLSDSMIAINKFNPQGISIPNGRVFIMVTYLAAQYLIALRSLDISRSAEPVN